MDNRWIWILLFCLTVMLAAWQIRERQSDLPSRPTISATLPTLSPPHRAWEAIMAKLDSAPRHAADKEAAIALALRTAYGGKTNLSDRFLETRWVPISFVPSTSEEQQLALVTTILPNDGLLAIFTHDKHGYTLLDLTTDLTRVDAVSPKQVVDDPVEELAITHTYDELLGAFFKITLCTVFKWSPGTQRLVTVWEYPLELEQYDPASSFSSRQTKRSQIKFGSNEITVYEVTTDWKLDRELDVYQPDATSTQTIKYIWDQDNFKFTATDQRD